MDPLHSIIRSLNQTEKRYFKIFASAFKNESNLIRLFDTMAAMEVYSERQIREKTEIDNLVRAKVSLRKLLLKAMRNYQEDIDIPQQLRDAMSDIEFLERKGMKAEALKEVKKAWKIAERSESYAYLTELLIYSSRLVDNMTGSDAITDHFDSLRKQHGAIIGLQNDLQSSILLNRYMTTFMRHASYETPEKVEEIVISIFDETEKKLKHVKSFQGKISLLNTLAFSVRDENKSMKIYEQIGDIYKANEALATSYPTAYLAYLNNYCMLVCSRKDSIALTRNLFAKTEKYLSSHENYFKYFPEHHIYYHQRLINNKLTFMLSHKEWGKLNDLENEVKQHVDMADKAQKVIGALQTAMLIACFYEQKKIDKTLAWVSTYYALDDSKSLKPLMFCVRLLEVLALHLNQDYDQSDTKAVNLYKTMIQQKFTGEYYRLLGTLLRRLNHWVLHNEKDQREIQKLAESFNALKEAGDYDYTMYTSLIAPDEILARMLT